MIFLSSQYTEFELRLLKENQELKKRILKLEKRLARYENPHTPSSRLIKDSPPEKTEPKPSGRKNGHEGSGRKTPEVIHDHKKLEELKVCPHCGKKLRLKGRHKRTTTGLVPGYAKNTEFDVPQSWCDTCHKSVEPVVPTALPNSRFDLSFALFVVFLKMLGMSIDKILLILKNDYGLKVSSATLINTMNKLADFLGPEYEKLRKELNREKRLHGDETGWKIKGEKHWLWEFVSKKIAYFSVEKSRGQDVPKKILDSFNGVLSVDFWSAYNLLNCEKQRCWQHLKRELEKILVEKPSRQFKKFAENIMGLYYWSKKERNHGHKTRLKAEEKLEQIVSKKYSDKNCLRLVKRLKRHKKELFTFCSKRGLPKHNNHAEQNIRSSVVIRKTTYGNQSIQGAQTFAEFMSFFQTSQLQDKNFTEYMQKMTENQLKN